MNPSVGFLQYRNSGRGTTAPGKTYRPLWQPLRPALGDGNLTETGIIYCSNCGSDSSADLSFCGRCGVPLARPHAVPGHAGAYAPARHRPGMLIFSIIFTAIFSVLTFIGFANVMAYPVAFSSAEITLSRFFDLPLASIAMIASIGLADLRAWGRPLAITFYIGDLVYSFLYMLIPVKDVPGMTDNDVVFLGLLELAMVAVQIIILIYLLTPGCARLFGRSESRSYS